MRLHQWMFDTASWKQRQGEPGGARSADSDVVDGMLHVNGASIWGRKMCGGGDGRGDESWTGWWGDDPPYHAPVFALTHQPRKPLPMRGGTTFTFVTDGIESALAQARAAAGDKDIAIAGGASAVQQYLAAGVLDELYLHIVPVILGKGERLLQGVGNPALEPVKVIASPRGDARQVPSGSRTEEVAMSTKESSVSELHVLMTGIAFGESPRWHDDRLWFCDWGAQELIAVDLEGRSEVIARVPSFPFCIDWLRDGRLLVVSAAERRLLRREPDGSMVMHTDLSRLSRHPWNDIVVDGRGNAYVGDIGFDCPAGELAPGLLALVTPDGSARQVADGVAFPNGLVV